MMNFDAEGIQSLLQNPAFLAGVSILTGDPRKGAGANAISGLQAASSLQSQQLQRQYLQGQVARQNSQAAFDPTQYLRGAPTTAAMGEDVQGPPTAMVGGQRMEPGAPRTADDMRGLLSGAIKSGYGMNDAAGIINALSPKKDLTILSPGASAIDGSGNIVATAPNAKLDAAPPTTRQTIMGNQMVTQQWNPDSKTWSTIGQGDRWQDKKDPLVEIADPTSATGSRMVPQSQAQGAPGLKLQAKDKPPAGKTLPATQVAKLATADQQQEALVSSINSFDPSFGGYKSEVLGNLDNQLKQKFGDKTGQAAWWQDVERRQTQVRHDLMGSQLTKYEGTQFAKFAVHPGQDPDVIKNNLTRQAELQAAGAAKQKEYYGKAGYNMDGFGGTTANVAPSSGGKSIVKTGVDKATGRKVVQYSDGTVGYGN